MTYIVFRSHKIVFLVGFSYEFIFPFERLYIYSIMLNLSKSKFMGGSTLILSKDIRIVSVVSKDIRIVSIESKDIRIVSIAS